jgi:hypothetical protein
VTSRKVDIERELARIAAGKLRTPEMLEASHNLMASAQGGQWSQAATYHGRALNLIGRIADGFALFEEAWQRADRLDDPVAGALATYMGAGCSLMLYDNVQAEQWCRRELERRRSRLIAGQRYSITDLLASARVSQGDLAGAREALSEWEGAASNHWLLAYCEGDWERSKLLLRKDYDRARDAGRIREIAHWGSLLGRIARIDNQRVEAEAILDEALQASLTCPDLNRELFIRIELALIDADFGRIPRAREELRRCKEILDNGEDWRGHQGAYEHVSALVTSADQILKFASSDGRRHLSLERQPTRLPEEVAAGFRAAIEIFRHYHAPWEESAAILYWSQALFAASQIRESFEKFITAFAIFDRIATPRWNERIQTDLFRFITWETLSKPLTVGDGTGSKIFRNEGDYWTIAFGGSMFRMRDSIGMHYVNRLVAHPAMEFSAQNLVAIAQKAIEKRGKLRNTRGSKKNGRANHARENRENADRERARLMVTKRIKDVIARIRLAHPALARHLATCIRTGHTCSYVADDGNPSEWLT